MKSPLKIASLFSGIGGFEKGIFQADPTVEIVFSSEFDPDSKAKDINKQPARIIYHKNFNRWPEGDITKIKTTDVPEHDILVGGPPCQDFSIAGKRAGICGTRGSMFYEFIRIAREKQPMLIFIENVKGLLSSKKGWDFARILIELEDAGYKCEWQLLNSKMFVPQNRERVFIIGHLRGSGIRPIFPITENEKTIIDLSKPVIGAITRRYEQGQSTGAYIVENQFNAQIITQDRSELRIYKKPDEVPSLKSRMGTGGNNVPIIVKCLTAGGKSGGLHSDMTAIKVEDSDNIRRLTPVECERLQGFPDNWTEGVSDLQRYKCLGNAVTVDVIEFIFKRILTMLECTS